MIALEPVKTLRTINDLAKSIVAESGQFNLGVVQGEDAQMIEGLELARVEGLINPILFGNKKKIESILKKLNIEKRVYTIVHTESQPSSVLQAAELVVKGEIDILSPGNIALPEFFRLLFDKNCTFRRRGDFISIIGVMEHTSFEGLLLISDVGLVPDPTVDEGIRIINNATHIAKLLGINPIRVGLLAFEDEMTPNSPTTVAESIISQFFQREHDPSIIVKGPIRLDQAMQPDALPLMPTGDIEPGRADILIANNIHSGNSMYKAMMTLCDAASAPIAYGGRCPFALVTRSESPQNILNSISLCILVAADETDKGN
ncbi:hypothetical protein K8I28_04910 [bacterium]|nr:hypothetical protein [bacterium]